MEEEEGALVLEAGMVAVAEIFLLAFLFVTFVVIAGLFLINFSFILYSFD